jgi:hypothetical protein
MVTGRVIVTNSSGVAVGTGALRLAHSNHEFQNAALRFSSNENKISYGYRDRASTAMEVC